MKRIDIFVFLIIIGVSLVLLKDLFIPGFYTSHDGAHQIVRLYYFDQLLHDGQFPPRWVGGLLNGFGYPLFVFSYHFPWFIGELLHLIGLSIINSIKMTFLVGFIISGITMYIFQKELFGRISAVAGTAIYLLAPYRFSNIFVRAAIGDATCFIFPPLIFLSLYKLKQSHSIDWKWIILGGLSFSGLLLSHAMVFAFFFITIFFYVLFWLLLIKKKKILFFSALGLILLGLSLSAYYLIPSFVERDLTNFSQIISSVYSNVTFLNIKQLIYSPWGYGTMNAPEGGMSLQLGITQWLVAGCAFLLLGFLIIKKSMTHNKVFLPMEAFFYLLIFSVSIFLMLPISSFFWQFFNRFILIDFTWRILALSIFSISILAGFIISQVKHQWLLVIFLIGLALYANRNHLRINQVQDWSVSFYLKLEKTTNSWDEYTPRWVHRDLIEKPQPVAKLLDQTGQIVINEKKSNYLSLWVKVPKQAKMRINTIYYPGWTVLVNNHPIKIDYESSGLMEFSVNPGQSQITARFGETPLRLGSDLLSLLSIGFVGSVIFIKMKTRKR